MLFFLFVRPVSRYFIYIIIFIISNYYLYNLFLIALVNNGFIVKVITGSQCLHDAGCKSRNSNYYYTTIFLLIQRQTGETAASTMICILLVAGHGTVMETQIKVSSLNVAKSTKFTSRRITLNNLTLLHCVNCRRACVDSRQSLRAFLKSWRGAGVSGSHMSQQLYRNFSTFTFLAFVHGGLDRPLTSSVEEYNCRVESRFHYVL